MAETILVDTGCWIALFDPSDEAHKWALKQQPIFESSILVMPWPVVYETLRTKFVKHPVRVEQWDILLKRPGIIFVDDSQVVEDAYAETIRFATRGNRRISMVDALCRIILADPLIQFKGLFTTNPKDFHDVCRNRGIELFTNKF